jgi:hypothetical protein
MNFLRNSLLLPLTCLALLLTACGGDSSLIGDWVWGDTNNNGTQDAGEAGVPNATVNLFLRDGTFVTSTQTDGSGNYSFDQLMDGGYYLVFEAPIGFSFTSLDQSGDDTLDSDADPATGQTQIYSLPADQDRLDIDAGLIPSQTVDEDPPDGQPDDSPEIGEPDDGDPDDDGPQSACDHPYFPLREGATWTFVNLNGQSLVWSVVSVTGDESNAQAVIQGEAQSPEGEMIAVRYDWYCDANGIFSPQQGLLAFDYTNPPAPLNSVDPFTFTRNSGATYGSAEQFVVNGSWINQFMASFTLNSSAGEQSAEITREESYTINSEDAISVPAGNFTALHIVGVANHMQAITVSSGQVVSSSDVIIDGIWLAEGVGIVYRERPGADPNEYTFQLVSYSFP